MCSKEMNREQNFWRGGRNGGSFQARCKPCHVLQRQEYKYNRVTVKKGRGWPSYPEEKKVDIKRMLDEKVKPAEIKKKYDVSLVTVYNWKKICAAL
jgi:hypothetical protein